MTKTKISGVLMMNMFVFFVCVGLHSPPASGLEELERLEMEHYLKTAEVVSFQVSTEGRTRPWEVRLDDGKVKRRGFFKHANRNRPAVLADSFLYELAAYELDKMLDLNAVPPAVERKINGVRGSLQVYLENCLQLSQQERRKILPPDPIRFQRSLEEIMIFENLTYDSCRDEEDILVHQEDWKVCRIDFSEAFAPRAVLLDGCSFSQCSRKLYKNLLSLDSKQVRAKLGTYLNEEEMSALLERHQLIIKKIKSLIAEKGEEAVLFD